MDQRVLPDFGFFAKTENSIEYFTPPPPPRLAQSTHARHFVPLVNAFILKDLPRVLHSIDLSASVFWELLVSLTHTHTHTHTHTPETILEGMVRYAR